MSRAAARSMFACSGPDDSYSMIRDGSSFTLSPDGSRRGDCTRAFVRSPGF